MFRSKADEKLIKLSAQVREVIAFAEAERVIALHPCLTTGHLVLGVLRTDTSVAKALRDLGIELEQTRALVHAAIQYGAVEQCSTGWSHPLTRMFHQIDMRNHEELDLRDLVIQLIRQPGSISSQVLASLGVTAEEFLGRLDMK